MYATFPFSNNMKIKKFSLKLKQHFIYGRRNIDLNIDIVPENGVMENTNDKRRPNKCKQCDFTFSDTRDLRTHLKTHSGEKSNK